METVGVLSKIAAAVPQQYLVTDNTALLAPGPSDLDAQQELLIKIPVSDLGFGKCIPEERDYSLNVLVRIVATQDKHDPTATDSQNAWLGAGLYQDRIIEADAEVGLVRIYPKSGHPMIWNYFHESPTSLPRAPLADQWVASCWLPPWSKDFSVLRAQCTTTFPWRSLQVDMGFPGTLIPELVATKEAVKQLLSSWAQ